MTDTAILPARMCKKCGTSVHTMSGDQPTICPHCKTPYQIGAYEIPAELQVIGLQGILEEIGKACDDSERRDTNAFLLRLRISAILDAAKRMFPPSPP